MSETAYKAVTAALKSPYVRDARQITYVVGDSFTAEGTGERGIIAFSTIDRVVDFNRAILGFPGFRVLELSYELADVLNTPGVYAGHPLGDVDAISLAAAHVVADVTP